MRDLDVVKREDFEAVKDMARLAREENEALKARIAALEAALAAKKRPRHNSGATAPEPQAQNAPPSGASAAAESLPPEPPPDGTAGPSDPGRF